MKWVLMVQASMSFTSAAFSIMMATMELYVPTSDFPFELIGFAIANTFLGIYSLTMLREPPAAVQIQNNYSGYNVGVNPNE